MATLDDILDAIRHRKDFIDLAEVTDSFTSGSKLKRYEVYFGKPGAPTISVEYLQIYVDGGTARIVSPCFMCDEKSDPWKARLKAAMASSPLLAGKKARIVFADYDDKAATIEAMVIPGSGDETVMECYRAYESASGAITILKV
jgi:hypothetical protein